LSRSIQYFAPKLGLNSRHMRSRFAGVAIAVIVTAAAAPSFAQQQPHNVILFIADGCGPGWSTSRRRRRSRG
jgi:alkaline phosphatase